MLTLNDALSKLRSKNKHYNIAFQVWIKILQQSLLFTCFRRKIQLLLFPFNIKYLYLGSDTRVNNMIEIGIPGL